MPLFNFQLKPIADIDPWGTEDNQTLHWFGLTDGWYWLDVGEQKLFHYTPQLIQHWERQGYEQSNLPYADYNIARLWEDMVELLPIILEPLPSNLIQKMNVYGSWFDWLEKSHDWIENIEDERLIDLYVDTCEWWDNRSLSTGHLTKGPSIAFWNDSQMIHIEWDNRGQEWHGVPVWTAQMGKFSLPTAHFIEELKSFDMRFMHAMRQRVHAVKASWPYPNVSINIEKLENEQLDRATWFQKNLNIVARRQPPDWEQILRAIAEIESDPLFNNA